ncbi:hypothetical protein KJ785_04240 [Patescibacteria group bacterium]|nr:hypothetical protein [Patescibacteria group bacterium]
MERQVQFFWVPTTGTEALSITESILNDNPLMRIVCLPPDEELFSKIMQLMQGGLCQLPILHLPGLGEWPSHERDIMVPFEAYNQFVTVRQQIYSTVCGINHHRVETLPVLVLSAPMIAKAAHYVALNGFLPPNDKVVFPSNTLPYNVYRDNGEFTIWNNLP